MTRLLVRSGRAAGVELSDGSQIPSTQVVLALGHSSRPLYRALLADGVAVSPQGCSVGLRVEHPQDLIDDLQLGLAKDEVKRGLGKARSILGRWACSALFSLSKCWALREAVLSWRIARRCLSPTTSWFRRAPPRRSLTPPSSLRRGAARQQSPGPATPSACAPAARRAEGPRAPRLIPTHTPGPPHRYPRKGTGACLPSVYRQNQNPPSAPRRLCRRAPTRWSCA